MIHIFHKVFFGSVMLNLQSSAFTNWRFAICTRAYVQFRGSEFHTRNARSRQLQEQRRAKAHSRQAKANSLQWSFPGSAWERFPRWLCHLRTEQAAEPPRTRSQAEHGNEHRSEFALAWRLWAKAGFSPTLIVHLPDSSLTNVNILVDRWTNWWCQTRQPHH